MKTFWEIAVEDLDDALFCLEHKKFRMAVFNFQQFAEKGAKALLEKKDPKSAFLRSHFVEKVLAAYDVKHKVSDLADKANYLSSFYFDTRYPGDNYAEIIEEQAVKAHDCAMCLKSYYESELERIQSMVDAENVDTSKLRKLGADLRINAFGDDSFLE